MNGTVDEDASATSRLLAEQARALVQAEESRFTAAQSRATTLLAVAGVIAGLGGGILANLDGREYEMHFEIFGVVIPGALVAACVSGAIAVSALLLAGAMAMGALQKRPDPNPKKLVSLVNEQFPQMLAQGSADSSRAVLHLLGDQLETVQQATESVNRALKRTARFLGVAVASGLALSALVLFGTSAKPGHIYLLQDQGKESSSARRAH